MVDFNERRYLEENPDVAEAVARGEITAQKHWEAYGRREGRRGAYSVSGPAAFDGNAYVANNPDVAAAVNGGGMTAEEHYVRFGQAEGRQPYYAGNDARTPTTQARSISAGLQSDIAAYADAPAPTGLRAGGLADTLERSVITPWRDLLRQVRAGTLTEEAYNARSGQLVTERQRLIDSAGADDFGEAVTYAGSVSPGLLDAVTRARVSAIGRTPPPAASAPALSVPNQATTGMQAAAETAAERARVQQRRGRGATLLTGMAGLGEAVGSVARRLLVGA